jgi:hypothetical protein
MSLVAANEIAVRKGRAVENRHRGVQHIPVYPDANGRREGCNGAYYSFSAISSSFRTVFQLRLVPEIFSIFSTCARDSFGRAMPLV